MKTWTISCNINFHFFYLYLFQYFQFIEEEDLIKWITYNSILKAQNFISILILSWRINIQVSFTVGFKEKCLNEGNWSSDSKVFEGFTKKEKTSIGLTIQSIEHRGIESAEPQEYMVKKPTTYEWRGLFDCYGTAPRSHCWRYLLWQNSTDGKSFTRRNSIIIRG